MKDGTRVRLIAECRLDDGIVKASVEPVRLPPASGFASTVGAANRVRIETARTGVYVHSGPGAGGPETGSAVLADILAVMG
jgi:homoserine dehydrogenase